jgi:hypothetical protein
MSVLLFFLLLSCYALENFSTVILKQNVSLEIYRIGNSAEEQSIDWYMGNEFLLSIPDPTKRLSFSDAGQYCKNICPSCRYTYDYLGAGLVSLTSKYNIALFNAITQQIRSEDNYAFWTGLQQQVGNNFIEPDEGFVWGEPTNNWLDHLNIRLWRPGQPDNIDDESGSRGAACACYDSRFQNGIYDCSCDLQRIPVCMVKCMSF